MEFDLEKFKRKRKDCASRDIKGMYWLEYGNTQLQQVKFHEMGK